MIVTEALFSARYYIVNGKCKVVNTKITKIHKNINSRLNLHNNSLV